MNDPIDYYTEYHIQRSKLAFWRCFSACLFVTILVILWIV